MLICPNKTKYFIIEKLIYRNNLTLSRFAEYKQIDTSIIDTLDSYSDTEDISDYAVSAFQWACGNEIISGFTDNTLRPKANTTRAQAAAVFNKIYSIK